MMFDPTKKTPPAVMRSQAERILQSPVFMQLLEGAPNVLMIINVHRQVVYLNRNPVSPDEVAKNEYLGKRPGECLACVNATKGELGCGSSEFCKVCGFNAAITASEGGKHGSDECHIALLNGASLTMSVSSKPFMFGKENFIFCTLENISEKKRRQMLESIFLHDILNTAAILEGLSETYDKMPDSQIKMMLNDISANINEEVQSYRLISNAETRTLKPNYALVDLSEITVEVVRSLRSMQKFRNRKINIQGVDKKIVTERTLLRRVLINLVKNALEASKNDDPVEVSSDYDETRQRAHFSVKNPQAIPRASQLKLFQKSFSTKGKGRGWGTYSIKVLTEKYLKGQVAFTTSEETGTIFTISIPSLEKQE